VCTVHQQDLLKGGQDLGRDASGNAILADVGPWLRDQFRGAFKASTALSQHLRCACGQPTHGSPAHRR
jgi:hypothetical protein